MHLSFRVGGPSNAPHARSRAFLNAGSGSKEYSLAPGSAPPPGIPGATRSFSGRIRPFSESVPPPGSRLGFIDRIVDRLLLTNDVAREGNPAPHRRIELGDQTPEIAHRSFCFRTRLQRARAGGAGITHPALDVPFEALPGGNVVRRVGESADAAPPGLARPFGERRTVSRSPAALRRRRIRRSPGMNVAAIPGESITVTDEQSGRRKNDFRNGRFAFHDDAIVDQPRRAETGSERSDRTKPDDARKSPSAMVLNLLCITKLSAIPCPRDDRLPAT